MEANRAIFRAAVELSRLNETIDPVTIRSKAGAAASQEYMLDLMQMTQTAANAGIYAQETRMASMRRRLKIIGESISARSDQSDEPRSVIADAQREFEELYNPVYIPGVSALYGGSRGILRVQREKRREVNGEYRDAAAHAGGSGGQKKPAPVWGGWYLS